MREEEIDRITPHRAMELLRKDGIDVDADRAKIILDFFYEMAEIVVDTYLDEQKIRKFTLTQKRESKFNQSILKS
ncbi:hypothetical protein SAMN05444366_3309 [Flavobacterium saccharophilum]|uniref:Uncharacterized protein n=2 Tax=Flavobacterium saccharophilum TaxID=29534 RepID=A0A1M7JD36_9FLAO|nr:hypothetical protein SAMN05444366_3309 [Flavobacterium saccharophilum]